nr:unnamed protein product [Callosobruchus chinensis]
MDCILSGSTEECISNIKIDENELIDYEDTDGAYNTAGSAEECISNIKIDENELIDDEDNDGAHNVKPNVEVEIEELITEKYKQDENIVVKTEPEEFVVTESELQDEKVDNESSGFIHKCIPPCRSSFTRKCYLEIHLKRHSSLTHCTWCSKDFENSSSYLNDLSKHLRTKAEEYQEEQLFCFYCCTQHARKNAVRRHATTYCKKNKNSQHKIGELRLKMKISPQKSKNMRPADKRTATVDVKLKQAENDIDKFECEFEDSPEYITISALTDLTSKDCSEVTKVDIMVKQEEVDMAEANELIQEEKGNINNYKAEGNAVMQEKDAVKEIGNARHLINSDLWRSSQDYPACRICGVKYRYTPCRDIHEIVHNEPMVCTLCDYLPFRKLIDFKSHVSSHLKHKKAELKNIELQCPYCGLRFTNRKVVIRHIRIHTDERPCKCDICGSSFRQISSLNTHLVTHSKEKAFICKVCTIQFFFNAN